MARVMIKTMISVHFSVETTAKPTFGLEVQLCFVLGLPLLTRLAISLVIIMASSKVRVIVTSRVRVCFMVRVSNRSSVNFR